MKKIGLALGGGGAKGLAHLLMLEALDEMGLKPACIAGASIGAVFGAAYASGVGVGRIREAVDELLSKDGVRLRELIFTRDGRRLLEFFEPALKGGGVLRGENFMAYLMENIPADYFEDLELPLKVVAADFWSREEVVFGSGPLGPAIRASMAIPWLFQPVRMGELLLIDGGAVNPLPYDLLQGECDITIAIDVMGSRPHPGKEKPGMLDYLFNTYQIMQKSIVRQKMRVRRPDVYIDVDVAGVRVMEFFKAGEIYRQAMPAKERLKRQLGRLLDTDR
ncbi:Patatin [Desulfarculus baarsii DSM 2075]|uniref:Patatin n=1 Tax=Desulfarculus baarsii (strain ATCC 33931 / DSM 2075 / LMG 7858 / VKM B-1802 / 2st14) TaxID=644282 RepID=E1QKL5_DESB2|nr:patatin-like phospholipase family protein [Desulfarculus baarsii]ADK86108.1 Patatin [Desulfarculus baarsii DSM 2075]